jgi:hypothetical protein
VGTTGLSQTNGRLRDRLNLENYQAEQQVEVPAPVVNAGWRDQWDQEVREAKAAAERARQAEIARRKVETERQEAARAEKAKRLPVEMMFTSAGATPDEIRRVTQLVNANCPEHRYNHEKQWMMLMELRSITQPTANTPAWKF